jgi:hypothetical protein
MTSRTPVTCWQKRVVSLTALIAAHARFASFTDLHQARNFALTLRGLQKKSLSYLPSYVRNLVRVL